MSVDGRFTARQPEKLDELEVHPNGLPVGVGGEKRPGEYSPRTDFASRVSVGKGANCLLRLQTLLQRTVFRVCRHRLGKTSVLILRRQLQSMRAKVEKVD